MTQLEVAERVAKRVKRHYITFDRSSLSYIENGDVKRPSPKVVQALAHVLDLTAGEIYAAEGDEEPEPAQPRKAAA